MIYRKMGKIQVVEMTGGLGNQMFQYAFYMALKNKQPHTWIDTRSYQNQQIHNGYELEKIFGIPQHSIHPFPAILIHPLCRILFKKIRDKRRMLPHFPVRSIQPVVYYRGYWQTERYFLPIEKEVRAAFSFLPGRVSQKNLDLAEQMASENSVSIHVRRGDYESNPQSKAFQGGICTDGYYKNAVRKIKELAGNNLRFYVFSDDIDYVEELFKDMDIQIIDWNRKDNSWQDMYLMSQCHHQIIANSSFSWWGAWLNPRTDKLVIAPDHWINSGEMPDILPVKWIKVATK